MKPIVPLPSFERTFKKLSSKDKRFVAAALEEFNEFTQRHDTSGGLRFKKIDHDKYEFRVDIRIRVIVKNTHEAYYLVLVGDHNDVRRYLKNYR